ncbi:ParA family protein [Polaribacter haliotis]|uniref:ParA family protein n=2 Tax=Polaribacter TaxID=52959 RepID=A0A7L8AG84_9FLAO|nr:MULTISPECIES: ParA family protein [Polaribacter]MDD7914095.1 ParA family protein [Polaribacter sp. MSW5]QOD61025.1 ParA family protein [Polaribacter haliotis]
MPKIILVTHQKGGVGKTTLTFNLAISLSKHAKILVIDLDLQGSLISLKKMVTDFEIITYQKEIINIKKMDFDFILIDTPPYLSNQLPKLISLADLILIPTKAGILDLLAVKSTIDLIEAEKKLHKALVIFNMIKANTTLTLDILIGLEEYNVPIAKTHISDLVAFTRSVLVGGVQKDRNAQKQLNNLTKEVLTKLI